MKEELSFHPLFEPWCDTFVSAVADGLGKKVAQNLFIAVEID